MIRDEGPCEFCKQPHTENFCNDGFHTENSYFICARYIPWNLVDTLNRIDEWWYEVPRVMAIDDNEATQQAEIDADDAAAESDAQAQAADMAREAADMERDQAAEMAEAEAAAAEAEAQAMADAEADEYHEDYEGR